MHFILKLVLFGFISNICNGKNNNKIEISATCDEIEQRKSEIEEKYCQLIVNV